MRYLPLTLFLILAQCKKPPVSDQNIDKPATQPNAKLKYFTTAKAGTNLRSLPNLKSKIIAVIPQNATVHFLKYGEYAEIDGIKDRWYEIEYEALHGWAFGGLLSYIPMNFDFASFSSGCLREDCQTCDSIRFVPGGKTYVALGCHFGHAEGTWRIEKNSIIAELTVLPSCYDSCLVPEVNPGFNADMGEGVYSRASEAFVLRNKHDITLRFIQLSDGSLDYEIIKSNRTKDQDDSLPPKPLGRMRHYYVSK